MDNKKAKNKYQELKNQFIKQKAELKASKRETRKLNQQLMELEVQKEEFISMAAHELRAPTTAIKGYISMVMEGDAGEISRKARGFLTDAKATNDRLIRLVSNMINVSRIEKGKIIYQMERVPLASVAKQVHEDFRYEAGRKGLKFSLKIAKNISDHIYVDPNRIREVITNLVSNAVKYTDSGHVSIKLMQSVRGKKYVRLEVTDSGPGVSREEQGKLFNKFYRVETTAGKTIGTGLGLYICKLIVKKFRGKIGIKSSIGKGSTFWLEMPVIVNNTN